MASPAVPAQLDTKAAAILVAQVVVWENHCTIFFMAKHWLSADSVWKKNLPPILPGD